MSSENMKAMYAMIYDNVEKLINEILNDMESFEWTDTDSGERNPYFEDAYGEHLQMVRDKYLTNKQ